MLQKQFDNGNGAMLAGQIQWNMVRIGYRVNSSRSCQKPLSTFEMSMNDCMYQWRKVVVIDEVDGRLIRLFTSIDNQFFIDSQLTIQQGLNHVQTPVHACIVQRNTPIDVSSVYGDTLLQSDP